ncbi:hypothetical protein ANN_11835 [Periplaneta americana]|uniref:Uncharacterized protein n=1 Tax=Periplaneta americana TaxID=6978 RepID=A0ABQ8T666_PERAM|nr:hypothetical protein ANN_11835 [Periplaneta americana]
MSPGSSTESYPAFAPLGLRENPGKTSTRTTVVGIATTRLKLLHTSCPHGEGLRNARHQQVRSIITTALKDVDYNTFEEVHGLSVTGSTRCIDVIAFKESTISGFIIDPTVCFETNEEQPAEVDKEKKHIYNPTIPYYLQKYQLEELEVIGLLVKRYQNSLHERCEHQIQTLAWTGHVARMGESRNAYRMLVGRPEGKKPLWRPRRRLEESIKIYLKEVGYDDGEWIDLAEDRDRWRAYIDLSSSLVSVGFTTNQTNTLGQHGAERKKTERSINVGSETAVTIRLRTLVTVFAVLQYQEKVEGNSEF